MWEWGHASPWASKEIYVHKGTWGKLPQVSVRQIAPSPMAPIALNTAAQRHLAAAEQAAAEAVEAARAARNAANIAQGELEACEKRTCLAMDASAAWFLMVG